MAATFYFGQGSLASKFTLPFDTVEPKAMTLDTSLGTVVIGTAAPDTQPVVYSQYPYAAGTDTNSGFPTTAAITSLSWV